jgi:hypothetical protein
MFNEQNLGTNSENKDVAEQKTDMEQVSEMIKEVPEGMLAQMDNGPKKSYPDGQGGMTIEMTADEYTEFIANKGHNN